VVRFLRNVTRVYRREGSRCEVWSVGFTRTAADLEIELYRPNPGYRDKAGRRLRKVSSDLFWYRANVLVVSGTRGFHLEVWDEARDRWAPVEYEGGVGCTSAAYPVAVTADGFFAGPEQWFLDEAACQRGERLAMELHCRP
jgi:hypothetical protein